MTDFGDMRFPKACKSHQCEWCGERIPIGERHVQYVGKWDGEFQNWRMHSECYDNADTNEELYEGFMPHEHARPMKGSYE